MRLGPVDAGRFPASATVGVLTLVNLPLNFNCVCAKFFWWHLASVDRPTVADAGRFSASMGPKCIDVKSLATSTAQAVVVNS